MVKTNEWIEFVKKWALEHNVTYPCAASDPKVREAYLGTVPTVTNDILQKAKIKAKNIVTLIKGFRKQQESIKKRIDNEEGLYDSKRIAKEQKEWDKLETIIKKEKLKYPNAVALVKKLEKGEAPARVIKPKAVKRTKDEIQARREARQDKKDALALEKLAKAKAKAKAKKDKEDAKAKAKEEYLKKKAEAKLKPKAKPKPKPKPKPKKEIQSPKPKKNPYKSEYVKYKVPKSVTKKAELKKRLQTTGHYYD